METKAAIMYIIPPAINDTNYILLFETASLNKLTRSGEELCSAEGIHCRRFEILNRFVKVIESQTNYSIERTCRVHYFEYLYRIRINFGIKFL